MIPVPEFKPSHKLAFPNSASAAPGMTYREWLIGMALQGLLVNSGSDTSYNGAAMDAIKFADAVIFELEKL